MQIYVIYLFLIISSVLVIVHPWIRKKKNSHRQVVYFYTEEKDRLFQELADLEYDYKFEKVGEQDYLLYRQRIEEEIDNHLSKKHLLEEMDKLVTDWIKEREIEWRPEPRR